MKHDPLPPAPAAFDLRQGDRTHAMLTGILEVQGSALQVRLRNISRTGALLETPFPIELGEAVTLKRMQVAIRGSVVRADDYRAALCFDEPLSPARFRLLKLGRANLRKSDARHRAEDEPRPKGRRGGPDARGLKPTGNLLESEIAKELLLACALLERSVEPLVEDFALSPKLANHVRDTDFVARLLRNIALIMSAADKKSAVERVDMAALRARLKGTAES